MKMGQSEAAAYETAVAKKPPDLAGRGVCAYVEVLGGSLQKQVADTSAYEVGDEAVSVESVERAQGIRAHLLSRYAVFLPGNDSRFHVLQHNIPEGKSTIRGFTSPSSAYSLCDPNSSVVTSIGPSVFSGGGPAIARNGSATLTI